MQKFNQKKIALAIGAVLLTMAGAAQAVPAAPAARSTTAPLGSAALVSALSAGNIEALLTTAGANVGVTIDLSLNAGTFTTPLTTSAATAGGSAVLTFAAVAGVTPGMTVSGTGVPVGATVASVTTTTVTMSAVSAGGVLITTPITFANVVAIPATGTSWTAAAAGANSTATVTSTANLAVGMKITSAQAGFPTDALINGITNATTFTFTSATTAIPVSAAAANGATAAIPGGATSAAANNASYVSTSGALGALAINTATPANNNVNVYTGTLAAATLVPIGAGTATLGVAANGASHVTIVLPAPGATNAYRINAGALEYSAAGAAFAPVKIDVQDVAAGTRLYTDMDGVAGFGGAAPVADIVATAITALAVGNAMAPTPIITTTGAPTAALPLINGVSVDTVLPIDAFTTVTNVAVTARDPGGLLTAVKAQQTTMSAAATAMNGTALTATDVLGTLGTAVAATATTPPTFKNTLGFLAAANWTNGPAADDALFATASTAFHTGVNAGNLPITLAAGTTAPKYTQVFNAADGTAKTVLFTAVGAPTAGNIGDATGGVVDGVAPVIVTAANNGNASLDLTFSEPMTMIGLNDVREIAENVILSGTFTSNGAAATSASLAAIALNNGLTLTVPAGGAITPTNNQSTLSIGGLTSTELASGTTVTVNTGITLKEANDSFYSATIGRVDDTNALDPGTNVQMGGGIKSTTTTAASSATSAAVEAASVVAKLITPAVVTVNFNNATAAAQTVATDATKVGQIVVTFPAAKAISLASGLTTANLVNQLYVTVHGLAAGAPYTAKPTYQFFPTAAQMALNAAGTTLTITLPTDQIYAKIGPYVTSMNVDYLGGATLTAGALVKKASSAVAVASLVAADMVSSNNIPVSMPFPITAATNALLTQSIIGSMTPPSGSLNGDKVDAYVAKWVDNPATVFTQYMHLTAGSGTTNGSKLVKVAAGGTAVAVGDAVTGTGIPAGTTVTAVAGGVNLTLSAAATVTLAAGENLTFTPASVSGFDSDLNKSTIGGQPIGAAPPATLTAKINASLNATLAAVTKVDGVNPAATAVAMVPVPVFIVPMGVAGVVGQPEVYDTLANAEAAQLAFDQAIELAAKNAAATGALATGSSGGMTGNILTTSYTNSGSLNSSMNAGVTAAVGSFAGAANTAGIPAAAVAAATAAAAQPNASVSSVVAAVLKLVGGPAAVKTASLDPVTGAITGGATGKLAITRNTGVTGTRGLVFIKSSDGKTVAAAGSSDTATTAGPWASGVVGTVNGVANSYNLLLGIEPDTYSLVTKTDPKAFVLLVHTPTTMTTSADLDLLTSADPFATNYMPFAPNLITGLGTRTTLATTLAKLNKVPLVASTTWALYGVGNADAVAAAPTGLGPVAPQTAADMFPRKLVGISGASGLPVSFWTSDGAGQDMALALKKQAFVATELGNKLGTMSTIDGSSFVAGASAFAWQNDVAGHTTTVSGVVINDDHIDVLQKAAAPAAASITVPAGWSLVSVPASMVMTKVDAIINVGSQRTSGYTWIKTTDGAAPAMTAGQPVFVYSTAGGAIN